MAAVRLISGYQGSYTSPYNHISTYDKPSFLDQERWKGNNRTDKSLVHNPLVQSSNRLISDFDLNSIDTKKALQSYNLVPPTLPKQDTTNSAGSNAINMDKVLSGAKQRSIYASVDMESDDYDGFVDIDELLPETPQKNVTTGGIGEAIDVGARNGRPVTSGHSSEEDIHGADSEITNGSLDADLPARSKFDSQSVTGEELADRDDFTAVNLRTCLLVTSQSDSDIVGEHSVVGDIQLPVSIKRPRPVSPSTKLDTYETGMPQANCDPIQVRTNYNNFDATDRLQDLEDIRDNQSGAALAPSPNVAHQNATASSPGAMYESDRIPVRGYLTLTAEESIVQYSFTFSQDLEERQDAAGFRAFQPDTPVADPGQQWEIRKIIGQKVVGREKYYRVEWKDTWMSESEMVGAKELVDAFIANSGSGTGGRKRFRNQSGSAIKQSDCQDKEATKKRRSRPRKQT